MKFNYSIALLAFALTVSTGRFAVSRVMAQASEGGAAPQQDGAQENSAAPNVGGDWQMSWTAAKGNQRQVSMQIKQNGSKLSGSFQGERGSAPLKGTLEGKQVSFTVKLPRRQVSFSGKVDAGKMSGTTENGASWTATRE